MGSAGGTNKRMSLRRHPGCLPPRLPTRNSEEPNFIGTPLIPWDGSLVQELTPRASSTPNTYSGIFGLDRFPFHSDLAHWAEP